VIRAVERIVSRMLRRPSSASFGDLRRVTPLSREFGFDRGAPVDRRYIEGFLTRHAADVRGRVLEVKDAAYTRRFGGARVEVTGRAFAAPWTACLRGTAGPACAVARPFHCRGIGSVHAIPVPVYSAALRAC